MWAGLAVACAMSGGAPALASPVDVLDRASLAALESQGWSFGRVLSGEPLPPEVRLSTLAGEPAWAALAELLAADIGAVIGEVDRPLVTEHAQAARWPAGNVGRAFDTRWLRSPLAFLQLAGVVDRADRQDIVGGCGELRLVYRLAYRQERQGGGSVGSRLPLTLNVVVDRPEPCLPSWTDPLSAPLVLRRVEVNAQVVRFPSGVETEFGGQAAYLLAVYAPEGEGWRRMPLENTPDVERLRADAGERARLRAWIEENLAAIDRGTYRVPEAFLATRAVSWSTLGSNRTANKPFTRLFGEEPGLPPIPEGTRLLASTDGLLERLDDGSCQGCHQAGSMAGFHLLGEDQDGLAGVTNRLAVALSPHASAEQERRADYRAALVAGEEPDRFRPHSLQRRQPGDSNEACLPEGVTAFRADPAWGCADPAERCSVLVEEAGLSVTFGQCVPAQEALSSGLACRGGTVTPGATADRDRFVQRALYDLPEDKRFSSSAYNCRPTVIGVPLGRAYRSCTSAERRLEGVLVEDGGGAEEICAVVGGSAFDACVAGDFHDCLDGIVARGMVDACDADRACREDYACQVLPWQLAGMPVAAQQVAEAGVGFCTPTYFLFQLRLDGHPVP